jgi:alpha-L-fucosidase
MLTPKPTAGDTTWFIHDRFGMFIHWGLYAQPARGEWMMTIEKVDPAKYEEKYLKRFDPQHYDPRQWAKTARAAGMKYVVITAKHHEGFCLWDSAYTDYKATNTAYGKDLLTPFVEAFRAEGLHVGLYYSLVDWHHPDFTIDVYHPLRDHPDVASLNEGRQMPRYAEYIRNQVTELLTLFQPDILWCDFSYPKAEYKGLPGKGRDDWESEKLLALIRGISPKIILNNRLDLPSVQADVYTPEQIQPIEWVQVNGEPVVWEACQTFSGAWGYHRDEESWKSPEQLIMLLINCVCHGGNLLMNVGPTPLGTFDPRALKALNVYGEWLEKHGKAIYGCTESEFTTPLDCRLTQNGNRVYIHVFAWPFRHIRLAGMAGKVSYARFLHDGSEVPIEGTPWETDQMALKPDELVLFLPIKKPPVVVPVIELTLKTVS